MLVFFVVLKIILSVDYANVGETLKISGTGEITEADVKLHSPTLVKIIDIQYGPTSIKTKAFASCKNLELIYLPSSLKSIETWAFSQTKLKNLTIPSSLESISMGYTFYFTQYFSKFAVEAGNQHFNVYDDCLYDYNLNTLLSVPYLKSSISFPPSINSFGTWAFMANKITSVAVPDTVKSIATMAFVNAEVYEIVFTEESQLTEIPENCFWQAAFRYFRCPPDVTKIGSKGIYDNKITNFTVMPGSKLTTLSASAFDSCTQLTLVILPSTIYSIDLDAFKYCSKLTNITIEGTSEQYRTYNDCLYNNDLSQLLFIPPSKTELEIPAETQDLGSSILQSSNVEVVTVVNTSDYLAASNGVVYSSDMKKVIAVLGTKESFEIDSRATEITGSCFFTIKAVSVIFKEDSALKNVPSSCFRQMPNLKEFRVPPNVAYIDAHAFQSDSVLETVFISKKVQYINSNAFQYCGKLATVEFEEGCIISRLISNCFEGCPLTNFTLPMTITEIDKTVFSSSGIQKLVLPKTINALRASALAGMTKLTTLEFETGYNYNLLPESFCSGNVLLQSIIIPSSVTSIGSFCFKNCESLQNIDSFENSNVESISSEAFYGCKKITSFTFPSTLTSVSTSAFMMCSSLTVIDGNLTTNYRTYEGVLYDSSFSTLLIFPHGLTAHSIHTSTTKIGENAFAYAYLLETINFPKDCLITEIGVQTFYNCIALKTIILPQKIKKILSDAFAGCEKLSNVSFSSGDGINDLEQIGARVFKGCDLLQSINLGSPTSLGTIDEELFKGCISLESFDIPNCVNHIGSSVFSGCTKLSNVSFGKLFYNINSGLLDIGEKAFEGTALSAIYLPPRLESLGSSCFSNCANLETVLISSCNSIGSSCFYGCVKLDDVSFCSDIQVTDQTVFAGCTALSQVAVIDSYKYDKLGGMSVWKVMKNCGMLPTALFTKASSGSNTSLSSLLIISLNDDE